MKAKQKTYTVAEVEKYKARMHKQHMKEMFENQAAWFADGYAKGKADVKEQLRDLLEVPHDPSAS